MNPKLTTTTIEVVLILGFAVVVLLSREQHVKLKVKVKKIDGSYLVRLNCTISQTPAFPVAVFLLNNKSLDNIQSSNESCFISQRKCQMQECECGLLYFIYNITLQFKKQQHIFTCEVRFDEKLDGHVAYRDSVLHNSSGIYSLNETKEVKGQPSPDKEPSTPKEQDDNEQLIIVVVSLVIVVISIVTVGTVCMYRNTRCLRGKFKKRIPNKNRTSEEERAQFNVNTSTTCNINLHDVENRNLESGSNSNAKTSADVHFRDAKYETVALAIKSAQLPSNTLPDDENRNTEEGVQSNDDEFYNISLLDVENKKLDGKDLMDRNESDGDEPKFYPPEIESYNCIWK